MLRFLKIGISVLTLCTLGSAIAAAQTCTPKVAPPHIAEAGKVSMMINPTEPPMQFVDSKGELQGLNPELGAELAKKLCLKVELVKMDFAAMIPALRSKRFDAIHTGLFWTDERSKIAYLVPYAQQAISVVVRSDSPLKIEKFDDLAGRSAGLQTNSYQERKSKEFVAEMTAKGLKPVELRVFNNATEALAALRAGQLDAFITTDNHALDVEKAGGAKIPLKHLGGTDLAFAFHDKTLAEAVAAALNATRADGSYDKLFDKFGMTPLPKDRKFEIRGSGPQS